jgi:hypothetical protein
MRVARMLWQGHHRQAYLGERRSQFDFPEIEVQGRIWWPYITFNVLKIISVTMADLLLGEDPALTAGGGNPDAQAELDALKTRSDLDRVFYDAAKTASWGGEALVEIIRWQNEVYIQDVDPREVFPLGERQPDGQYPSYARFATAMSAEAEGNAGGGVPRRLLLQATYLPGRITRACFFTDEQGARRDPAGLSLWPVKGPGGADLLSDEATGIEWNTMVWMANEIDGGRATSDYDGLIELQDELNAKQTQIARVIAMHGDPMIAFHQDSVGPDGNMRVKNKAIFFRSKEEIPQYIVWNAQLEAAMADRDFTLNALCMAAEMSQGLLGLEKGGAPDSARKLRLQATKTLARVKRKAKFVKPFIQTALDTALQMIQAGKVVRVSLAGANGKGSAVDLRDGLPVDDLDQAQVIATLAPGRQMLSLERGVGMQINDPAAAAQEVARIEKEAAAAAPSVNITGPIGEATGGDQGIAGQGDQGTGGQGDKGGMNV